MGPHPYSLDDSLNTAERLEVAYRLAWIAGGLVGVVSFAIATLTTYYQAAALIAAPSTVVVYHFLVRQVELRLWKWSPARFLLGITIPNINGMWKGTIETRRKDGVQIAGNTGTMMIRQSWSNIGVEFDTDLTCSQSTGGFMTMEAYHLVLMVEYTAHLRNCTKDDAALQAHRGSSRCRFLLNDTEVNLTQLEVSYYTDHRELGIINLHKT